MRILFELHGLKQRRALQNLRAEMEEGTRRKVEAEVRHHPRWMNCTLILADHCQLTLDTGIAPVTLNGGNSAACSAELQCWDVTSNNVHTSAADKIIIAAIINIYWLGSTDTIIQWQSG